MKSMKAAECSCSIISWQRTLTTCLFCRRETHCDFCSAALPNWRSALTPETGADAPAVMNVTFDGLAYSFNVRPGPDGYEEFANQVRLAFNLPENSVRLLS